MIRSPVFLAQPDTGFFPLSRFADSLEQPPRVQVLTPGPGFSIPRQVIRPVLGVGWRAFAPSAISQPARQQTSQA